MARESLPSVPWTIKEIHELEKGVCKHGVGNWTAISQDKKLNLQHRKPNYLRMKYETLVNSKHHGKSHSTTPSFISIPSSSSSSSKSLPSKFAPKIISVINAEAYKDLKTGKVIGQFEVKLDNGRRAWMSPSEMPLETIQILKEFNKTLKIKSKLAKMAIKIQKHQDQTENDEKQEKKKDKKEKKKDKKNKIKEEKSLLHSDHDENDENVKISNHINKKKDLKLKNHSDPSSNLNPIIINNSSLPSKRKIRISKSNLREGHLFHSKDDDKNENIKDSSISMIENSPRIRLKKTKSSVTNSIKSHSHSHSHSSPTSSPETKATWNIRKDEPIVLISNSQQSSPKKTPIKIPLISKSPTSSPPLSPSTITNIKSALESNENDQSTCLLSKGKEFEKLLLEEDSENEKDEDESEDERNSSEIEESSQRKIQKMSISSSSSSCSPSSRHVVADNSSTLANDIEMNVNASPSISSCPVLPLLTPSSTTNKNNNNRIMAALKHSRNMNLDNRGSKNTNNTENHNERGSCNLM